MRLNETGLNLIKSFESCRLDAYKDQGGTLTVGYGHTGVDVYSAMKINQSEADNLLKSDLTKIEAYVDQFLTIELNDNQFSALVSFTFNVGPTALKHSTLLAKILAKDFSGAGLEFLRWDKINGADSAGLLRRRKAEKDLFLS